MTIGTAFFRLFFSPEEPEPDDAEAVRKHKRAMAIWRQWIGLSQLLLWGFFWWAIGMGSGLGIDALGSGFARAETVERIEVQLLSEAIMADHIRFCAANSADGKGYFADQVTKKLDQYRELTGRSHPPLPSCADLKGVN